MRARGFTLVELIVTSVIGVLVAGAIVTSVSSLQRARMSSLDRQQAYGRADAAAARIELDLENVVRNADLTFSRVAIVNGGQVGAEQDDLLMLARSARPVRGETYSPEGADFEVQYKLRPSPSGNGTSLWRRIDPALDPYLDAGGVAAAVAAGVVSLSVQAYDGTEWFDTWDSDSDGVPHAVRVSVVAASDDGRQRVTSRRIIAIDRVPLAPASTETETTGSGAAPAAGGGR